MLAGDKIWTAPSLFQSKHLEPCMQTADRRRMQSLSRRLSSALSILGDGDDDVRDILTCLCKTIYMFASCLVDGWNWAYVDRRVVALDFHKAWLLGQPGAFRRTACGFSRAARLAGGLGAACIGSCRGVAVGMAGYAMRGRGGEVDRGHGPQLETGAPRSC